LRRSRSAYDSQRCGLDFDLLRPAGGARRCLARTTYYHPLSEGRPRWRSGSRAAACDHSCSPWAPPNRLAYLERYTEAVSRVFPAHADGHCAVALPAALHRRCSLRSSDSISRLRTKSVARLRRALVERPAPIRNSWMFTRRLVKRGARSCRAWCGSEFVAAA